MTRASTQPSWIFLFTVIPTDTCGFVNGDIHFIASVIHKHNLTVHLSKINVHLWKLFNAVRWFTAVCGITCTVMDHLLVKSECICLDCKIRKAVAPPINNNMCTHLLNQTITLTYSPLPTRCRIDTTFHNIERLMKWYFFLKYCKNKGHITQYGDFTARAYVTKWPQFCTEQWWNVVPQWHLRPWFCFLCPKLFYPKHICGDRTFHFPGCLPGRQFPNNVGVLRRHLWTSVCGGVWMSTNIPWQVISFFKRLWPLYWLKFTDFSRA